jgi:hypothetical protein
MHALGKHGNLLSRIRGIFDGFCFLDKENGRSPETLDVIGRLSNRCSERRGDLSVKTVDLLAHDDDSRLAMTVDDYAIAVFDGKIHDLPEGSFGKCKFGKDIDSLFR